ncbi:MAG: ATP-binding protein [Bacteroidota bacterium]|nr:ATP-binding protein [Bacteroidota bacterium]
MEIRRNIEEELKHLMESYKVVTLTGPRQSGKTTLAKMTFPDYNYLNLENPQLRKLAEEDPETLFNSFKLPLIIDEIQRMPDLLSYIQIISDERNEKGMFLLTGSHQLKLNQAISQSLVGRTALLELLPFSIAELHSANIKQEKGEQMWRGFLPGIYDNDLNPTKAYRNYFQTYVERDVRQLMQIRNLSQFENFVRLLVGRVGSILNLQSLTSDLGISSNTLKEWLSILEASYIIFRLYPYFENFGKRATKTPKLYFTDVGLACYLLGIEKPEQVNRDPLAGNLFENMVVMDAVKTRLNKGMDTNLYYFRDNNENEVDLVYLKNRKLIPIEIKMAMTFHSKFRTTDLRKAGFCIII